MNFAISNTNVSRSIVQRVRSALGSTLTDSQSMQIAIASAMRDDNSLKDVIGVLLSHHMHKTAIQHKDAIKMTLNEWNQLFSFSVSPVQKQGLGEFVASSAFQVEIDKMNTALKLTLQETEQSTLWKKPWHQLVVFVAMHMDYVDEALLSSLGTIIKADKRKIEELINNIDDTGVETLLFTSSIELLSNVCCLI